jgi:hypothetical protein
MTISLARAKKTAVALLRENRKNRRSWRTIAREDYHDQVDHSTIHRFATSKGQWLPKNERTLMALGLIKERKHVNRKTINEMNNNEIISMCQRSIQRLNHILQSRGMSLEIIITKRTS